MRRILSLASSTLILIALAAPATATAEQGRLPGTDKSQQQLHRGKADRDHLLRQRTAARTPRTPGRLADPSASLLQLGPNPTPGAHLRKARVERKLPDSDMRTLGPQVRRVLAHIIRTERKGAATFDGDGTLWSGDVGEGFFNWMLKNRHYPEARIPMLQRAWRGYRAGTYNGEKFYELMVTAMAGMQEQQVKQLAREYFDQQHRQRVYRPMVNLVSSLGAIGIASWVVSGSPYWVVAAGARHLGIPHDRVIGLSVRVDDAGRLTNEVVRPVPWKSGKAKRIMQQVGSAPVLAAGNSYGDIQMLRIASELPLVINPGPQVLRQAKTHGWTIHRYTRNDHMNWGN